MSLSVAQLVSCVIQQAFVMAPAGLCAAIAGTGLHNQRSLRSNLVMPSRLRRRVITSPIARLAAVPMRAMSVLRYDALLVGRSLSWLVRSGETMNIGYEL